MGRKKTYNTEEMIGMLNEYRMQKPGIRLTIPKFVEYLESKGYTVGSHTLRRDEKFREYLESMNESEAENEYNDLVTYRTIDAQAFIEHNKTVPRMKEALVNRDRYYSKIASKAVRAIKEKNECLRKIEELEDRIRELEQTIEEMTAAAEKMKKSTDGSELQEKDMLIIKLRGILDDYIYPDMANAILKKEKILEAVNSVVSDESAAKNMMPAGDSINEQKPEKKKSRFGSVDSLMSGFDEE